MKVVTSLGFLPTAEGIRMTMTYSEVNENGEIIKENNRKNVVLMDKNLLSYYKELEEFAHSIVDSE